MFRRWHFKLDLQDMASFTRGLFLFRFQILAQCLNMQLLSVPLPAIFAGKLEYCMLEYKAIGTLQNYLFIGGTETPGAY